MTPKTKLSSFTMSMLCIASLAVPAQTAIAQTDRQSDVQVTVVDARGRSVPLQRLNRTDRARLERLQGAMTEVVRQEAARIRITIRCSWPPLTCTITVRFPVAQN